MSTVRAERRSAATGRECRIRSRIATEGGRWDDMLPDAESLIETALGTLHRRLEFRQGFETELGITLTNDEAVRSLNAEWRGKDKPTNVLSFPIAALEAGDAPGLMLGDLVLALETLEREASAEAKPLGDHFCHLVIHGALHCLGYDHETEAEAAAMEALEVAILADLGIPDPYRGLELQEEPARA